MNPEELNARLDELRHRATTAAATLARATSLLPDTATGRDPTGAITATLGADNVPVAFQVAGDWVRRIPADAVAAAVVTACHTASADRLREWGEQLQRHNAVPGPRDSTSRRHVNPRGTPLPRTDLPDAPSDAGPAAAALLERLRTAQHEARAKVRAASPTAGRTSGGHLTVTLTIAGLTACTADPEWTADQSAARLATALGDAVRDARRHLAQATTDINRSDEDTVLHDLATDALATLRRLETTAQPSTDPLPRRAR